MTPCRIHPLGKRAGIRADNRFGKRCICSVVGLFLIASLGIQVSGAVPDFFELRTNTQPGRMVVKVGEVNYHAPLKPEVPAAKPQPLYIGDTLQTLTNAIATVKFDDGSGLRMWELTRLQLVPPTHPSNSFGLYQSQGQSYVSSRGVGPKEIHFTTFASGVKPRGTEYLIRVDPRTQRTDVTMFDGEAELTDGITNATVRAGQQGTIIPGLGIRIRPVLEATNIVQWWIYYPGILDPDELNLTPTEQIELRASLNAYRSGDLHAALKSYPGSPTPLEPDSEAKRIYLAALLLTVGAVDQAQAACTRVNANAPLVLALRKMIAAVSTPMALDRKMPPPENSKSDPRHAKRTSSEYLALSYQYQSFHRLAEALEAARASIQKSPKFAFGWERVAELEFSFGRTEKARQALGRALQLAPRNAQAHALNGFLLSADNHMDEAQTAFDEAIRLDPNLGNAWLGRGLCRIREGYPYLGRDDLQTAAVLEPNRSLLRSYLGKAFNQAGEFSQAKKELDFAKRSDTNDPTPWFYSALLSREENRINEGVRDLEKAIDLNDNRIVYRSRLLLDQDHAVRSSSLANIYQSAGLTEVALNEAARSVNYDYANYSAHLFLSESFDALRDPTRFNLRYETVWFNEKLLADLLGPVGSVPLSQHVSQQEYARLFERDRLGISSATEYRSDGQMRERASQFGTFGSTGYALDLDYQHNDGVRPNNQLDRLEWYSTVKQQLTPRDSLLLLAKYQEYHSGDNFQYYDPKDALPDFKFDEYQQPILVGGYHHEWAPGVHTLLLGGRLVSDERFSASRVPTAVFFEDSLVGGVVSVGTNLFDLRYHSDLEIYTAELNQIFQSEHHQLVFGGRYQDGRIKIQSQLSNPALAPGLFNTPAADTPAHDAYRRGSIYSYYTVSLLDRLLLTGGIAYDSMVFPRNFRAPPVVDEDQTRRNLSPKAGFVWSPLSELSLRGAYTRSLSGVSLEQSYRLEPTQVAGFSQTYRSIIPESLAGSLSGTRDQTADLSLHFKLSRQTYLGLQAEWLSSEINQTIGVFNFKDFTPPILPSSTTQRLEYEERSLAAYVSQLVSDEWSLTAHYKFTRSELATFFPQIPSGRPDSRRFDAADLHQVGLALLFNHPSGFFSRVETQGFFQHNSEASAILPDDSFAQLNLVVGYRFPRQHGEVSLGVLNANDSDYRLNPLNVHPEFPRERVFIARLLLNF